MGPDDQRELRNDALGRRVLKVVTNKGTLNGTTRFLWGGNSAWQCLEERDGSGNLEARYTYAPGYIDAVAVQERDLTGDGDFGDDDEVVYYHSNTLYSVYALTDGSENVAERYRYSAYGQATVLDADWSADADGASDVSNAYAFTARRLDAESGLMQYRHRYYAPLLGRFISRDPVGYVNGRSLYRAYFIPTALDPLGLLCSANPYTMAAAGFTAKEIAEITGISLAAASAIIAAQQVSDADATRDLERRLRDATQDLSPRCAPDPPDSCDVLEETMRRLRKGIRKLQRHIDEHQEKIENTDDSCPVYLRDTWVNHIRTLERDKVRQKKVLEKAQERYDANCSSATPLGVTLLVGMWLAYIRRKGSNK